MAVTIDISYLGDLHCEATHGPSGARLETDAPVDNEGRGETFSPTDLAATGLGTCLVTIMGIVAKRHGWDLTGTRVRVVKEMTADPDPAHRGPDGDDRRSGGTHHGGGGPSAAETGGRHLPGEAEPSPGREGDDGVRVGRLSPELTGTETFAPLPAQDSGLKTWGSASDTSELESDRLQEGKQTMTRANRESIERFVSGWTLALVGASATGRGFGCAAYKELKARGYRVLAVHPSGRAIHGDPCWRSLAEMPERVERLLVSVKPDRTDLVIRDAAAAGVRQIWFQQGAESPAALETCRAARRGGRPRAVHPHVRRAGRLRAQVPPLGVEAPWQAARVGRRSCYR